MKIKTNNRYRDPIYFSDLSDDEKSGFDWIDDVESETFYRYRGQVYHLGEFVWLDGSQEWNGAHATTAFTAILVKISDCGSMACFGYQYQ